MSLTKFQRIIFLPFLLVVSTSCKQISFIEEKQELTIVHLYGTPYEQGLAHGELLKEEIHETISKWQKEVERIYQSDFKTVISVFFASTSFIEEIEKTCPDILDEVRGISKGCGIDYETVLAFQVSEEIATLSDDLERNHCTSISINAQDDQPTLLAQNMDPDSFLHGYPTLLHITDCESGVQSYVFTFPGFIGLNGLNSKGVGIACNSISMLNHTTSGLPVSFIVRKVLQQSSGTDAFEVIENVPIGIPQCFTIGGMNEARCYECSANMKKLFYPFENKEITLHTNFSISNRDFKQQFIDLLKEYGKTVDDPYFCPRYFLAYDKIVEANYNLDVETVKSILSLSEPEINPISNDDTYGCLIMELSDNPILYISPGKPDEKEFIHLKFN